MTLKELINKIKENTEKYSRVIKDDIIETKKLELYYTEYIQRIGNQLKTLIVDTLKPEVINKTLSYYYNNGATYNPDNGLTMEPSDLINEDLYALLIKEGVPESKIINILSCKMEDVIKNINDPQVSKVYEKEINQYLDNNKDISPENKQMLEKIRDEILIDISGSESGVFGSLDALGDHQIRVDQRKFAESSKDKDINGLKDFVDKEYFNGLYLYKYRDEKDKSKYVNYINTLSQKKLNNPYSEKLLKCGKLIKDKLYTNGIKYTPNGINITAEAETKEYSSQIFMLSANALAGMVRTNNFNLEEMRKHYNNYLEGRKIFDEVYREVKENFKDVKYLNSNLDSSRVAFLPLEYKKDYVTLGLMNHIWIAIGAGVSDDRYTMEDRANPKMKKEVAEYSDKLTETLLTDPLKTILDYSKDTFNRDYNQIFGGDIDDYVTKLWDYTPHGSTQYGLINRGASAGLVGTPGTELSLAGEIAIDVLLYDARINNENIFQAQTGQNVSLAVAKLFANKDNPVDYNIFIKNCLTSFDPAQMMDIDDEVRLNVLVDLINYNEESLDDLVDKAKKISEAMQNANDNNIRKFVENPEKFPKSYTSLMGSYVSDREENPMLAKRFAVALAHTIITHQMNNNREEFLKDADNLYKICTIVEPNCEKTKDSIKKVVDQILRNNLGFEELPKTPSNTATLINQKIIQAYDFPEYIKNGVKYRNLPDEITDYTSIDQDNKYKTTYKFVEKQYSRIRKYEKKALKNANWFYKQFTKLNKKICNKNTSEKDAGILLTQLQNLINDEKAKIERYKNEGKVTDFYAKEYLKYVSNIINDAPSPDKTNLNFFNKLDPKTFEGMTKKQKENYIRATKKEVIFNSFVNKENFELHPYNLEHTADIISHVNEDIEKAIEKAIEEAKMKNYKEIRADFESRNKKGKDAFGRTVYSNANVINNDIENEEVDDSLGDDNAFPINDDVAETIEEVDNSTIFEDNNKSISNKKYVNIPEEVSNRSQNNTTQNEIDDEFNPVIDKKVNEMLSTIPISKEEIMDSGIDSDIEDLKEILDSSNNNRTRIDISQDLSKSNISVNKSKLKNDSKNKNKEVTP